MKEPLAFIIPFLFVVLATPLFKRLSLYFGVLDFPGRRKIHNKATPLLGGAAIYFGLLLGALINIQKLYLYWPILVAATLILIVGIIDDKKSLTAQFRIFCQLVAALFVIGSGLRVTFLSASTWGYIGNVLVTLIWIVGLTNAYNYLDGMDGLANGSVIINLLCFTFILSNTGQRSLALLTALLAVSCLGFFFYNNFRKASIFLGDAGSTFLGFMLACIALAGDWAADNVVKISIPILILGVPIFDMIFTTIMRIKEEKIKTIIEWLRYGGKDHFHHYLVYLGLHIPGAVLFIYVLTLSLGLSAIIISNGSAVEAFLSISQASIIFGIIAVVIVVGKRHRSGWVMPNRKVAE